MPQVRIERPQERKSATQAASPSLSISSSACRWHWMPTACSYPLPFDLNRLAGVAASSAAMAAAILLARHRVNGTGLLSLIAVSLAGGIAYAGAAWLFNVASIRTLSMRLLRGFNRSALGA